MDEFKRETNIPTFSKPISSFSRVRDNYGSGQYNASRDNGKRRHQGLDIISKPGEFVKSPIKGVLEREARPYPDDPTLKGVVIKGVDEFEDIEVKMFYVAKMKSGNVAAGEVIGKAQDLSARYKGITNHIHIEVRRKGLLVSPMEYFNSCF